MEWLYHIGVPENQIEDMAEKSANTIPCMMPYITAFFMPRKDGDRPLVVPNGSVNFAFLGQFAETKKRYNIYNRIFYTYSNGSRLHFVKCR